MQMIINTRSFAVILRDQGDWTDRPPMS